jgi:hypothetical protein
VTPVSVVGACVLLGAVVLLLLRTHQVRVEAALVCVIFGLVLGSTPAGPAVNRSLTQFGSWAWAQVSAL